MTKLTSRQRQLLQEDKCNLVDTIVIMEDKLEKFELAHRADLQTIGELMDELKSIKNEMELISESNDDKILKRGMNDIEKELDKAWEGNLTSENFVDKVTKIFTGDYYDKDKKSTSND